MDSRLGSSVANRKTQKIYDQFSVKRALADNEKSTIVCLLGLCEPQYPSFEINAARTQILRNLFENSSFLDWTEDTRMTINSQMAVEEETAMAIEDEKPYTQGIEEQGLMLPNDL